MLNGQICIDNNCHKCCTETEMLLTKTDIKRIGKATGIKPIEFTVLSKDGHRMLKNYRRGNKLKCFFLNTQGMCKIHDVKPDGCQFYPIIWDLENHAAIKDDFCPHFDKFELNKEKSSSLENFILRLFGKW